MSSYQLWALFALKNSKLLACTAVYLPATVAELHQPVFGTQSGIAPFPYVI